MHNEQNKNPEIARFEDLQPAFEAVNREVLLSGAESYRLPTKVYGERQVNGQRIMNVDNQPAIVLQEVSGANLMKRIPDEQHEAVAVLGIKPDEQVTLSFGTECFQRGGDGTFVFEPASAELLVRTEYANNNQETRAYDIGMSRLSGERKASSNFTTMIEMEHPQVPEEELPDIEIDETDVALYKITNQEREKTEFPDADKREIVRKSFEGRDITAAEAQAIQVVASHFSQ